MQRGTDASGNRNIKKGSLTGELVKKWLVGEDGRRYLIKGNYGRSCQQSLNEVLATKVHSLQGKMPNDVSEFHPSVREIRVAPIFDSGNAMFWDRPRLEDVDLADISVSSFQKKAEMLEEFQR